MKNGSVALPGDSKKYIFSCEDQTPGRGDTLWSFIICDMNLLPLSESPDNNVDVYYLKNICINLYEKTVKPVYKEYQWN